MRAEGEGRTRRRGAGGADRRPVNREQPRKGEMKITLAQIKLKTGDFEFNFENILRQISSHAARQLSDTLVIFPQADLVDLGGKDLVLDEKCRNCQIEFYQKIADKNFSQNILIGDVLIRNGEVEVSDDGFYDICGKSVFVSDTFIEDIECDLYVLAKNRYFAMNTYKDFVDSIEPDCDFVYVNAIGLSDANVFAGGSFAKNADNNLVLQMPVCEEDIDTVDFSRVVEFEDEPMEKQVFAVTTFALKEYCENTGFKKVVLGLSGGIDSALTAAIAVKALGAENVFGILMPSMFSSEGSVTDSLKLAENLGMQTVKEPITPLFDAFMQDRERRHDLAEENLQARLRGLILMFYSNRENMLLLSTGNKSESAMGFGTLYGDLAGGYNLICDLTKTNVYKLSNYINRDGEIIPQEIIDKAPSAELHPNQKDSDRLPEYDVLDQIIEMYLEQNIPADEIPFERSIVDEVIRKIHRFQFKRHQACLGVRLTERAFCGGVNLPVVQRFY